MNLVTIKCPGCGASLELNEERTTAYCSYCGRKLYVDDENAQDAAYEARQRKKREKVLEELDEISAAIARENAISSRLDSARADLMAAQKKLSDLQNRRRRIPLIIIAATIIFILGILASDSGAFLSIVEFLLICAVSTGAYKLNSQHYKDNLLRCQQAVVKCSDDVDAVEIELADARKESGSFPIQEEYRNTDAIEYMRKVISAGRAQNLADSILLYEEYLQRQQLQERLEAQNEQLSRQNAQLRQQLERQGNQLSSQSAKMADLQRSIDEANEAAEKDDDDTLGTVLAVGGIVLMLSGIFNRKD
jgi:uncharacterized Zn finger protein (UPF0148 family)